MENVTIEVPGISAIAEARRGTADYFADLASEVLGRAAKSSADDDSQLADPESHRAWGLVAARLGRKQFRSDFRNAVWFCDLDRAGKSDPSQVASLRTRLNDWAAEQPQRTWAAAVADFRRAEGRVLDLLELRAQAESRLVEARELQARIAIASAACDQRSRESADRQRMLSEQQVVAQRAAAEHSLARGAYDRQVSTRPGVWETILTLGRATSAWRADLIPLQVSLDAAEQRLAAAHARTADLQDWQQAAEEQLRAAVRELDQTRRRADLVGRRRSADAAEYGAVYPGEEWVGDAREKAAAWQDPELNDARADLFLAALRLHQDFMAMTARRARGWWGSAIDVVAGDHPPGLEVEKVRAAWQLFFLAVPLVSTTFASAGRMLDRVGREGIGWLFIDEAGQAAPQQAVAAIWRARRVVAVGDPLQLQPVVTMPRKALGDIAHTYGVDDTWIPPLASVQTLADRVAPFGTELPGTDSSTWVSAPLRVHRRCDAPMFGLSNDLAYGGIMISDVRRTDEDVKRLEGHDPAQPRIPASCWIDVPASDPGTHRQSRQLERFRALLADLREKGIEPAEVIAISPFKAVADELGRIAKENPGLRGGTIHTAQGREAPIVFLVLGSDPQRYGARAWAAETPNLVNVAVSRAKRRLYVIGDRGAWEKHNYFSQLAEVLGDRGGWSGP